MEFYIITDKDNETSYYNDGNYDTDFYNPGLNVHDEIDEEVIENQEILDNFDEICNPKYLWRVTCPNNNPNFKMELDDSRYYVNMFNLEERYDLHDLNTWIMMKNIGVDLTAANFEAIDFAVRIGNLDILKFLLANGFNINQVMLRMAVNNKNSDIFKFIVESGINVNYNDTTLLNGLIRDGSYDMFLHFISNGANVHNLHRPIEYGLDNKNNRIVKYMIEMNFYSHQQNEHLLIKIIEHRNFDQSVFNLLIRLHPELSNNHAALISAIKIGNLKMVKFFINHRTDPSLNDNEALRWAMVRNYTEIINYLNNLGLRINSESEYSKSWFARNDPWKHCKIIEYLINHGADIHVA